jgi:short-subunit dehydrogenase
LSDVLRFEVSAFGVDVIVIEPGLIRTEFGQTAAGSVEGTDEDGAYAGFNAAVAATTASAYEGPMARLGAGPGAVARTIERAISRKRPRTRYAVTNSARLMLGLHAVLPDRAWDRVVGSAYPLPRAGEEP